MDLQVPFRVSLAFHSGLRFKSASWGQGQDARTILLDQYWWASLNPCSNSGQDCILVLCNHTGQVCHRLDLGNKDCFADIFSFYYIYMSEWDGQIMDCGDKRCSLHWRGKAVDTAKFLGLSPPLEQGSWTLTLPWEGWKEIVSNDTTQHLWTNTSDPHCPLSWHY